MTVTVLDLTRKQFQAEGEDSVGNNIDVSANKKGLEIRIENPWAGDTETGFGQSCYIDVSKEDALKLARFIIAVFNAKV